jgi:lipoprotein-releasing system permease protein
VLLSAVPRVTEWGTRIGMLEHGLRIALTVLALALFVEGVTRLVDRPRNSLADAPGVTLAPEVNKRRLLIHLATGLVLIAVGVVITLANYRTATSGTYVIMYGPIVTGLGTIARGLLGGFKTFVAWRYLLVFKRKVSQRAAVAFVFGAVFSILALIRHAFAGGGPTTAAILVGSETFLLVSIGWGILRHSKPAFVFYVIGFLIGTACLILTQLLAPTKPVSPFDPATAQTMALQAVNIIAIVGFALMGLAVYLGLLRSLFTFFTVIPIVGVWVGTAALVMVLAVMSGFETDLRDKILGSNAHIQVTKENGDFVDWEEAKKKIDALPGVLASTPYGTSEVVIAANNNGMNVIIKGIDPSNVGDVTNLISNLEDPDSVRRLEPLVKDPVEPEPEPAPTPTTPDENTVDPPPDDMPDFGDPIDLSSDDAGSAAKAPTPPPPPPRPIRIDIDEEMKKFGGDARRITDFDDEDDTDVISVDDFSTRGARTQALPGILVGRELVKQTHLYVGEEVRIVSPISDASNPDATGTPIPYNRDYRVAGIFFTGMYEYDLKYVYVTLDSLQSFLDRGDAVDGIEVRIADADDTDRYVPGEGREGLIRDALGPEYKVQDWRELNRSLFSALKLEKIAMFVVLGIVILVASFSIVGNLIMVVVEKQREIALLKTLGATDMTITQLFAVQGLIIGVIGTVLGIAFGLVGCWAGKKFGLPLNPDVYYIDKLPIHVDPTSVVAAAIAGVVISIAATLYPALLASRVRPAAGMRH